MKFKQLGILVQATLTLCSLPVLAAEGFYTRANLPVQPKSPGSLDRMYSAAAKLEFGDSHCSGTFVSRDGYYLTAAHCIFDCLKDGGDYSEDQYGSSENDTLQKIANPMPKEVNDPKKRLRCPKLSIPSLGLTNPEVVYVGKGVVEADEITLSSVPVDQFNQIIQSDQDFALIRFDVSHTTVPLSCAPTRLSPVQTGEMTWAVGFPGLTHRGFPDPSDPTHKGAPRPKYTPYPLDSDGKTEYVTYGAAEPDFKATQFWQEYLSELPNPQNIISLYSEPSLLITDEDGYSGNSGSGIIDQDGNLIAIFSSASGPGNDPQCFLYLKGAALSIRLSYALPILKAALGTEYDQAFACPQ